MVVCTSKVDMPHILGCFRPEHFENYIRLKGGGTVFELDCHTLCRSRGSCEWFDRHKKCVGKVLFHSGAKCTRVLSFATNKNPKD